MSFALLVYASAYLKRYHPAAFCAGLLNAQPMGFYSPQSLVGDARRHGVRVQHPDLHASQATTTLEPEPASTGAVAVRLGLATVRGIGTDLAEQIVADRTTHGRYPDLAQFGRRVSVTVPQMEALATAGVFDGLGLSRRDALWAAGAAARERSHHLPGLTVPATAPALPGMSLLEITQANVWATGISPDTHPVEFLRRQLEALGALATTAVGSQEDGTRILVGGAITHRQRPGTASGITFLNLEDEHGMLNIVVPAGTWRHFRRVALSSKAMLVRGTVQIGDGGVVSLLADRLEPLRLDVAHTSRDFR